MDKFWYAPLARNVRSELINKIRGITPNTLQVSLKLKE